jgi:hypothetical protein
MKIIFNDDYINTFDILFENNCDIFFSYFFIAICFYLQ